MDHSEGQSGYCAVISVGQSAELAVNEGNAVLCQYVTVFDVPKYSVFFRRREGVEGVHDHDHLLALPCRQQVVQDQVHLSLPDPADLVLAAAVVQIPDGISFVRFLIVAGRKIYPAVPGHVAELGAVQFHAHAPVWDVLEKIEGILGIRRITVVGEVARAVTDGLSGIQRLYSVHIYIVIVETRLDLVCGHRYLPPAVLALRHEVRLFLRESAAPAADLHAGCIRIVIMENHASVLKGLESPGGGKEDSFAVLRTGVLTVLVEHHDGRIQRLIHSYFLFHMLSFLYI